MVCLRLCWFEVGIVGWVEFICLCLAFRFQVTFFTLLIQQVFLADTQIRVKVMVQLWLCRFEVMFVFEVMYGLRLGSRWRLRAALLMPADLSALSTQLSVTSCSAAKCIICLTCRPTTIDYHLIAFSRSPIICLYRPAIRSSFPLLFALFDI